MAKKHVTKKIIPAVAYCRKSTEDETTEKSIADQMARIKKLEPPEQGAEYEIVKIYDKDKGVPGWKQGASRPDYFRLVNELKDTKAKAILVDDMDRFSRADEMVVVSDVQALRAKHGIKFIHAANQGLFELVSDPFLMMKIGMAAMASHEHCTRLSRRIANARKDAALKGRRSGGEAPYGFENDGQGGLKLGDPQQVKTVKWIFEQFANKMKSMCWIAKELNAQGIKTRRGNKWSVETIKELLERRAYCGDFEYNRKKSGQFYNINNDKFEVQKVHKYNDDAKNNKPHVTTKIGVFVTKNTHPPIITSKLFDAAQIRLASFSINKNARRPREDGYPLSSGILVCDHCGKPMRGFHPTNRERLQYKCSSNRREHGSNNCGNQFIYEDEILPFVLKILGEEIGNIGKLITPKPKFFQPDNSSQAQIKALEKEIEEFNARIDQAVDNVLCMKDPETRKAMDEKITAMRTQLAVKKSELAALSNAKDGFGPTEAEVKKMSDWWQNFSKKAVHVPLDPAKYPNTAAYHEAWNDGSPFGLACDRRMINEALHQLGCVVRLRWKTTTHVTKSGKTQRRYEFDKGRLQLGQRKEAVTLYRAPLVEGMGFTLK